MTVGEAVQLSLVLPVGLLMCWGIFTAAGPSPSRWRRPQDPPARIDPDACAERLVDEIARGPLRTRASILAGDDVPCSAVWQVALHLPARGWWLVTVGPDSDSAKDLTEVCATVRGRLAAIVAERDAKLLAELRPLVAEPEPLVNVGKAYDGVGVPWGGER